MKKIVCNECHTVLPKFKSVMLEYIPIPILSILGLRCEVCKSKFDYTVLKYEIGYLKYVNQAKNEMTEEECKHRPK